MLSFIYARDEHGCIGRDGGIPWRLPDDFAHFKRTTMGRPIIMGRRTYEDHESALPGRLNIVVTRQAGYRAAEGVVVVHSLDEALRLAARQGADCFVIGGSGLFVEAFDRADRIYETVVHTTVDGGDTFVPRFDLSGWPVTVLEEHPVDDRHRFAFTVRRFDRPGTAAIMPRSGD